MTIEIKGPDFDGYCVLVNGETILECMSEKEIDELTVGELRQLFGCRL